MPGNTYLRTHIQICNFFDSCNVILLIWCSRGCTYSSLLNIPARRKWWAGVHDALRLRAVCINWGYSKEFKYTYFLISLDILSQSSWWILFCYFLIISYIIHNNYLKKIYNIIISMIFYNFLYLSKIMLDVIF